MYLPLVLLAYRAVPHASNVPSPFFLFGRLWLSEDMGAQAYDIPKTVAS